MTEGNTRKRRQGIGRALLGVAIRVVLLLGLLAFMIQDVHAYRIAQRGIESGLAVDQPPLMTPRMGINVALERYATNRKVLQALHGLRDLGYGTLRQRFSWGEIETAPGVYDWARWDYVLELVREEGFAVIAVLDGAPGWARSPREQANPHAPPHDYEDYARFAAAFAERYRDHVLAYQIWDQPNIHPHWGTGEIDPAGYVDLLAAAAPAIRAADPRALIIAGGLAPNLEEGGRNLSDVRYLQEIYRRGAGDHFDVLGVKAYGFWSDPYDRRVSPEVLNFSRVILLRQEMLRRGEGHKPVWALDGGWVALPDDWQGEPSPLGSDAPILQAGRMQAAMRRVQREWPWMTLFVALHLQPNITPDDPLWGLSLLDSTGQAQALLTALQNQTLGPADGANYPGLHPMPAPTVDTPGVPQTTVLTYWGSHVALWLNRGVAEGELEVVSDDEMLLSLEGNSDDIERVWLARNQPLAIYPLYAVGTTEQLGAISAIQVGNQMRPVWLYLQTVVGLAVIAWLSVDIWQSIKSLHWQRAWRAALAGWRRLPEPMQVGALAALLIAGLVAPLGSLRLALLACYGLGALLRPDLALLFTIAAIPLAPLQVALGPGRFSIVEIVLLTAVAAHLGHALLAGSQQYKPGGSWRILLLDTLVLLYVLWGAASAGLSEYQRVAWREFRVVIAEPALLYALLRMTPQDRRAWRQRVDLFFASAAALALYALARYPTAAGVIRAEGVRRARAFFGSPNNLALYLERFLPLGVAVALWGAHRWRRMMHGAGAAVIALATVLTFSRGAWLLGIPAGLLLVLALHASGRNHAYRAWVALIGGIIGIGVLLLVVSAPRLGSLTDLTQGTGFLRMQLWRSAWEMALDHPWLGVGPDNFLYYYGDYIRAGAEIERHLSHPHNVLLDFWLRLGLPGLLLLVAVLGTVLAYAVRLVRSRVRGNDRALLIGLLGGLAAAGAHGLIDAAWFVPELAYWGMFVLAWLAGCRMSFDNDSAPR